MGLIIFLVLYSTVKDIIGLSMVFQRNAIPYIWSYFMPVITLTLFGAASFFIPPDSIPGRVALLLTIELVMMNLYIAVKVSDFFYNCFLTTKKICL